MSHTALNYHFHWRHLRKIECEERSHEFLGDKLQEHAKVALWGFFPICLYNTYLNFLTSLTEKYKNENKNCGHMASYGALQ